MIFPLSYADECYLEAQILCDLYGFELNKNLLPRLHLTKEHLELLSPDFKPIFVDFLQRSTLNRVEQSRSLSLIKACKPCAGLKILDATAGFGRDAFVLASMGAKVLMLERSPILVALLRDGLLRLENTIINPKDGLFNIVNNLSLVYSEALSYISNLKDSDFPDVIYLDPMHPARKKSALVKKEMQLLQNILGTDENFKDLLINSISKAKQRVVVKWPQKLQPLIKPHYSIPGKTIRFDIFINLDDNIAII